MNTTQIFDIHPSLIYDETGQHLFAVVGFVCQLCKHVMRPSLRGPMCPDEKCPAYTQPTHRSSKVIYFVNQHEKRMQ